MKKFFISVALANAALFSAQIAQASITDAFESVTNQDAAQQAVLIIIIKTPQEAVVIIVVV